MACRYVFEPISPFQNEVNKTQFMKKIIPILQSRNLLPFLMSKNDDGQTKQDVILSHGFPYTLCRNSFAIFFQDPIEKTKNLAYALFDYGSIDAFVHVDLLRPVLCVASSSRWDVHVVANATKGKRRKNIQDLSVKRDILDIRVRETIFYFSFYSQPHISFEAVLPHSKIWIA
jgi:hypothetical protein